MLLLILGVLLWSLAHLAKRVLPGFHAAMRGSEKPMVTAMLVLSIVLMVLGYRSSAGGTTWWAATPMLKGINNLMVLAAFYLFAASGVKSRLGVRLRHPQLIGFSLWAAAHLLVNGDLRSVVLFGGLLAWALAEIVVIDAQSPGWTPPAHPVPIRKEWIAALAAAAAFVIVGLIHGWIGPNPFGA